MRKIQLPAIGGIRKVIEVPDAGTTIAEIGSGSITLAQLAKLITVQQQNATAPTSNLVGDGSEATLKLGAGLSGGGVLLGNVSVRLDAPAGVGMSWIDDAQPGPDYPTPIPGTPGPRGATGPAYVLYPDDPDDPQIIPGAQGLTGATGPQGPSGTGGSGGAVVLYPDDPDDPQIIPGAQGLTGATGPQGPSGSSAGIVVALNDDQGEELPLCYPSAPVAIRLPPAVVLYQEDQGEELPIAYTAAPFSANPSASVGLSAVNGSAATFMRSDAAPALSQSISPTWTGNHTFQAASGLSLQVNGVANQTTAGFQASSTTGQAYGVVINAGTNSGDFAMSIGNTAATQSYFKIRGDGAISVYNQSYEGAGTINASGLYVAGTAVSTAVGANPSASIGLTAVNGSATTWMRSDGAPALSQSISPTWTGNHTFNGAGTPVTINAGSGQVGMQINAGSGQWGLAVQGNTTAGSSYGTLLQAGANSSDITLQVKNAAASRTYAQILGDGTGFLGNAIAGTSATAISWDSSGNVSIGSNSSGGLFVNQAATLQGSFVKVSSLSTGTVYSNSGTLTNTNPSDARLKKDIAAVTHGLETIRKLRPVTFKWEHGNQGTQFGFIAQEVQEVLPEAVTPFTSDGETYLGLEKDAIYGVLVKAVQELAQLIESRI